MGAGFVSHSESTARRLQRLAQLYQHGQASALMDRTLEKLLKYETELSQAQLRQLRADLAELEQRYGLTSADFYSRFQSGQTDDHLDYVEWASLIQMAQNVEQRLEALTSEAKTA